MLAESRSVPLGTDLAVGVKGNFLYQNIYFGNFETPSEDEPMGVQAINKDKEQLGKFFKGVPLEDDAESNEPLDEVKDEEEAA